MLGLVEKLVLGQLELELLLLLELELELVEQLELELGHHHTMTSTLPTSVISLIPVHSIHPMFRNN